MSDQSIQPSALNDIREKAEADLRRAERTLERAKDQVEAAKAKLRTVQEIISMLTKPEPPKSQKDRICEVIKKNAGAGVTIPQIITQLEDMGFPVAAKNQTASVQVAADRLVEEGIVESSPSGDGKIYKWKGAPTSANDTEASASDELELEEENP